MNPFKMRFRMLLDMAASVLFAKSIRDMAEERMRTHISLDIAMMSIDLRIALTRLSVAENELAHQQVITDSLRCALWGYEADFLKEEQDIATEDAIAMEDAAIKKDASLPYDYAREERNHFDALDYRDALDLGDPFPEMACL